MASAAVRRWAASIPAHQLSLSVITVLELGMGVLAMERKDPRQGRSLRSWLQAVVGEFSSQILPFTTAAAFLCAAMHTPNRSSDRDAMIAATAKEYGCTVVTRNIDDFRDCGVRLLNPWLTFDKAGP